MTVEVPARIVQQREFLNGNGLSWEDLALVWRLDPTVSSDQLSDAMTRLFERHEALRSTLVEREGRVVQHVEAARRLELEPATRFAADGLSEADALSRCLAPLREARVDMRGPQVVRAVLISGDDGLRHLALLAPHALLDAWSVAVLERELNTLLHNREPPPAAAQLGDVAAWESAVAARADDASPTAGGATLVLPTIGRERHVDFDPGLASARLASREIAALAALARGARTTVSTSLLSALFALLAGETAQHELVIGVQDANRDRAELESVVGSVTSLTLVSVAPEPRTSFAELLIRVGHAMRRARADRVPVEAQVPAGTDLFDRSPFTDVVFNRVPLRGGARPVELDPARARLARVPLATGSIRRRTRATPWGCQITMNLFEAEDGSTTILGMFNRLAFDARAMAQTVEAYKRLVAQVAVRPHAPVADLVERSIWD